MAMDMDEEQLFRLLEHGWSLRLESDQETRVTPPGPNEARRETLCVTDVFLVHPESAAAAAAGQGAVLSAWVKIGTTRNEMLAVLSAEKPHQKLKTPVVLDEEFCFYMVRAGGDDDDDPDPVLVQFQGYARPSADTNEEDGEVHEEDDEGYDYEYDIRDDGEACGLSLGTVLEDWPSYKEEELSDGEVHGKAAMTTGNVRARRSRRSFVTEDDEGRFFGGPPPPPFGFGSEHARQAAPKTASIRNFLFFYLIAMVALFVYFRFFGGGG